MGDVTGRFSAVKGFRTFSGFIIAGKYVGEVACGYNAVKKPWTRDLSSMTVVCPHDDSWLDWFDLNLSSLSFNHRKIRGRSNKGQKRIETVIEVCFL